MTLWIGNGPFLKSSSQWQLKIFLKINNPWTELFDFQNSFKCHGLELLRTPPLPIHKVIIITIFYDGIYLYFVNKHLSSWPLLGLLLKLGENQR